MPRKRRRVEPASLGPPPAPATTAAANEKPMSAFAAARLRAEEAAESVAAPEVIAGQVPVPGPASPLSQSPPSEHQESDQEDEHLPLKQNVKLCTWRSEAQHILSDTDKELTVKLNKHATIALIGCFQFKVLRGAININGANIGAVPRHGQHDRVYTAHVPATHPVLKFRGLDEMNHVQFLHCEDHVPLEKTGPLFADIWNVRVSDRSLRSFSVVTESDADPLARPLNPETCPEDWLRAIEECAADSSIVVALGASSTGKSTFTRRLVNRFLTGQGKLARSLPAICYLDLDYSKPEYTPQGQVSLVLVRSLNLGPSFSHPSPPVFPPLKTVNETVRSHCVPSNPKNYRDYYRICAEDLFLAYKGLQAQDPLLPLVVNTSGSLYDFDFDLLLSFLAWVKPQHAVYLGNTRAVDAEQATKLPHLQTIVSQYHGTIHEITTQPPPSLAMRTDADLKAMHMQSYFHLVRADFNETKWTSDRISELVPWNFCYEETEERMQNFVGFAMYSEPVEPASLLLSLNGSVIQVVESTASAIPTPYTALSRTKRHRLPYVDRSARTGMVEPLDPRTSKMVCTALVRGFDLERKVVQVLVPRSHEALLFNLLPERTMLVGGCCDSPEWAYLEDVSSEDSLHVHENIPPVERGCKPWVEVRARVDAMAYLNTVRRVRKFQA